MTEQDKQLFHASKRLEQKVNKFLNSHKVPKNYKGREYLKLMIIYQTNKKIYQRETDKYLYQIVAEYCGVIPNTVEKAVLLACYTSNKEKPIYPVNIMYDAWYKLKLAGEIGYYESKQLENYEFQRYKRKKL